MLVLPLRLATLSSPALESGYIKLSSTFLQTHIHFGLKQIVASKELIAHYENQIAEYHLLLDVAVYSRKTWINSAGATKIGAEAEMCSLRDEEDQYDSD